jgi:hypothetical protein
MNIRKQQILEVDDVLPISLKPLFLKPLRSFPVNSLQGGSCGRGDYGGNSLRKIPKVLGQLQEEGKHGICKGYNRGSSYIKVL